MPTFHRVQAVLLRLLLRVEPVERDTGAPERTRLEFEHRNLDRHEPGWEGVRDGVADEAGWPLYLAKYAEVVAGTA